MDEHLWHHTPGREGAEELTGMVDLTRHDGRPQARLLDLVPGRSGKAYADWLSSRGEKFTAGMKTATLDPFRGYSNAIRDELQDATAVLDAFHVVRLGLKAMEETRRRVQQEQLGHRGRKQDPLYRIRNALRAGADKLTARQIERIQAGLQTGDRHFEVIVAWRCYQQLRSAFPAPSLSRAGPSPSKVSIRSPPAPSPRSPGSAVPYPPGAIVPGLLHHRHEPTTAAPKPSTASSNSTAASPAGSATHQLPTTDDLGRRTTHPPKSPMSQKWDRHPPENTRSSGDEDAHGAHCTASRTSWSRAEDPHMRIRYRPFDGDR